MTLLKISTYMIGTDNSKYGVLELFRVFNHHGPMKPSSQLPFISINFPTTVRQSSSGDYLIWGWPGETEFIIIIWNLLKNFF